MVYKIYPTISISDLSRILNDIIDRDGKNIYNQTICKESIGGSFNFLGEIAIVSIRGQL